MKDTLLLNTDCQPVSYLPLSTISWQLAVKLVFLEKATVLKYYDDWEVHSPTTTIQVPSILMMNTYLKWKNSAPFTRKNLYLRDNYECQYCGEECDKHTLTFDHVIPRSMGGKTNWHNIVTACKKCNYKKADNHLIRPKNEPKSPSYYDLINKIKQRPITIREMAWNDYLGWDEDLITIFK